MLHLTPRLDATLNRVQTVRMARSVGFAAALGAAVGMLLQLGT